MSTTYKLTPSESVTVLRSTPELLEVEGRWGPEGSPPPAHHHPEQHEHFEVLEGRLIARVDGQESELFPGDSLDIPRGVRHQMWNEGERPARALWQTRPSGRTEDWFRSIDAIYREGRVGRKGEPGPLAFGPLLSEYQDVFRLAVAPQPLIRPLVSVLGILGRARGHRPASTEAR